MSFQLALILIVAPDLSTSKVVTRENSQHLVFEAARYLWQRAEGLRQAASEGSQASASPDAWLSSVIPNRCPKQSHALDVVEYTPHSGSAMPRVEVPHSFGTHMCHPSKTMPFRNGWIIKHPRGGRVEVNLEILDPPATTVS
jgi:hypothetical protein